MINKDELKNYINSLCPEKPNIADVWWEWAEYCQRCENLDEPDNPIRYRSAEMFLAEFASLFYRIKESYGDEIVKKIIMLPYFSATPHVCEIMNCAKEFAAGKTPEQISVMEVDGTLDDIREYREAQCKDEIFKFVIKIKKDFVYDNRKWVLWFKPIEVVNNPKAAVRAAVKDFILSNTDEAKEALRRTEGEFIWGDVFNLMPESYFRKYGIELIDKKMIIEISVDYDENFFNDLKNNGA